MRLLLFYAPEFWSKPFEPSLPDADQAPSETRVERAVVVFYQAEAEDAAKRSSVLSKTLKNIKWLAGKFETRNVVLHSFGHLSSSKADPDFARELMSEVASRLEGVGYAVAQTPFGWFNEWKLHVAGESLAKVFKEF